MARRARSQPATVEARQLALTIRQGERAGLTQKQIGERLGVNERTIRKIKSGQTSGTRTVTRLTAGPRRVVSASAFNAEFVIGRTADGQDVIGSTNIRLPELPTAGGGHRRATALDIFNPRIRTRVDAVVAAQRAALVRRYEAVATVAPADSAVRLRRIGTARKGIHDIVIAEPL